MKNFIRFISIIAGGILFCGSAFSQDTKGLNQKKPEPQQQKSGKTYALIVGISKYQYPTCYPTLHYADVDAKEFYNYLTSKTGGNVDTDNVVLLLNDQATQGDFWKSFNSIKNRLQKNDNFYIYFSGHGDAINTKLVYLLTYNAPPGNDKNGYFTFGGVVDIHTLKSLIEMITLDEQNPANVILITDACRSNELPPGGEEGKKAFYEEMFTKNSGEIQFVSCMANQVSYEDAKWGGGRGLFSWHLINGLIGMADKSPEDGIVTPEELSNYVSEKVQKDAYDSVEHKAKQKPKFFCPDKRTDFPMAHVDKATKDALAMKLKVGGATTPGTGYAVNKGVNLGSEMKKAGYEEWYKKFIGAINDGRLIDPAGNNAYEMLQEVLKQNIKPELKSDLKFELSSRLNDDVTQVMNTYLHASTNNNNYTFTYFNTAARKLRAFKTISDPAYYNPVDIEVNRLFLEGHQRWHSTKTYDLRLSLAQVDSAIALKPQASFLYNLKGLMHISLKQYKEAEATLRKGIELAPKWLYPYHNLASTFMRQTMYDSAKKYFFGALAIDSNYQTTYQGIGVLYSYMGNADSERHYYIAGLKKDPTDPHLWLNLGYSYYMQKDLKNALKCFYNGMYYDSTASDNYAGALRVHIDNKETDSIKYYTDKMIHTDSTNPQVYTDIGYILAGKGYYTKALNMFSISITIDSMNAATWVAAADCYQNLDKYTDAENCLLFALTIDPTASNDDIYNSLGLLYNSTRSYDKALKAWGKAIMINPNNPIYYFDYAYVSAEIKDFPAAEKYYRKAIALKPAYHSACYELSKILASQSKIKEALKMLEIAVKNGEYNRKDIEAETEFARLKDDKTFKEILQKAKN